MDVSFAATLARPNFGPVAIVFVVFVVAVVFMIRCSYPCPHCISPCRQLRPADEFQDPCPGVCKSCGNPCSRNHPTSPEPTSPPKSPPPVAKARPRPRSPKARPALRPSSLLVPKFPKPLLRPKFPKLVPPKSPLMAIGTEAMPPKLAIGTKARVPPKLAPPRPPPPKLAIGAKPKLAIGVKRGPTGPWSPSRSPERGPKGGPAEWLAFAVSPFASSKVRRFFSAVQNQGSNLNLGSSSSDEPYRSESDYSDSSSEEFMQC